MMISEPETFPRGVTPEQSRCKAAQSPTGWGRVCHAPHLSSVPGSQDGQLTAEPAASG